MSRFENIKSQHIVSLLLFLLPVFAITVRHWLSSLFGVLALFSIVLLFVKKSTTTDLRRDEKILLWAFGLFFLVFLVTSIVNGWGDLQTRYSAVEIRFLLFIPIYLMIRQVPDAVKWLLLGTACSLVVTFWDGIDTVVFRGVVTYEAIYGPLFTGPMIVLLAVLLIPAINVFTSLRGKIFFICIIIVTTFTVILTGARSAFLVLPVLTLIALYDKGKEIHLLTFFLLIAAVSVSLYFFVDRVSQRVEGAHNNFKSYMSSNEPVTASPFLSSTGVRLEMWRITPHFFKDSPIFGVGRGNYRKEVQKYVDLKLVHKDVAKHAHPHNVYSEMLISKGVLGVLAFVGITLLPLGMLLRGYRGHKKPAIYGILLISAYLLFSLFDASTFIKGNFVAFYVVFLSVFFSYHIREKQKKTE